MPAGRPWEYFDPRYRASMRRQAAGLPLQMARRQEDPQDAVPEWAPAVSAATDIAATGLGFIPVVGPAIGAGLRAVKDVGLSAAQAAESGEPRDVGRAFQAAGQGLTGVTGAVRGIDRQRQEEERLQLLRRLMQRQA